MKLPDRNNRAGQGDKRSRYRDGGALGEPNDGEWRSYPERCSCNAGERSRPGCGSARPRAELGVDEFTEGCGWLNALRQPRGRGGRRPGRARSPDPIASFRLKAYSQHANAVLDNLRTSLPLSLTPPSPAGRGRATDRVTWMGQRRFNGLVGWAAEHGKTR